MYHVLISFVVLSVFASLASSQTICTSQPSGNLAACYAQRSQCQYNLAQNACIGGAPTSCAQYLTDSVGCLQSHSGFNCTFKTTSQLCVNLPVACSLVNTSLACNLRSDCKFNTTSSKCVSATSTCGNQTNAVTCQALNCFWDPYITQCFNSLAEVLSIDPCSTWSNYPPPNAACPFHGCSLDSTGLICLTPGAVNQNASALTSTLQYQFVNPRVLTDTMTFQVDIWLPNQIRVYPAYWTYVSIGGGNTGYSYSGGLAPGFCNDVTSYNATIGPPYYTAVTNPTGLQAYFNNWVTTNHNYNFPASNLTFGAVLLSVLGPVNISSSSIVNYVNLDPTQNYIIQTLSVDLTKVVTNCSKFGAYLTSTGSSNYYTIPVDVIQRDYLNDYIAGSSTFYVAIQTTGTITVGASSNYQPVLYLSEVTEVTNVCPAGQALLNLQYTLKMQNVFTNNIVGPRNASDIFFTSPQFNNSVMNCYNDTIYAFSFVGCYTSTSMCIYQITTRTLCRTITPDGNAFNNCSAVYNPGTSYSQGLNSQHPIFIQEYKCPTTANASNNYAGCISSNTSPTGFPDYFPSTLAINIFPQSNINVQFDVYAGLLPYPTDPNLGDLEVLTQTNQSSVNTTLDLYQSTIRYNGVMTFVVGMLNTAIQSVAVLTITLDSTFSITPLDPNGVPIVGGRVLYWPDVFPYMTYVPEQAVTQGYCSPPICSILPSTVNNTAYDGFAIPVITLRALSPANGYSITVDYSFALPTPTITANQGLLGVKNKLMKHEGGARRKLLQQTSNPSNTVTSGVFAFNFFIDDNGNERPVSAGTIANITSNFTNPIPALQCQVRVYLDTNTLPSSVPVSNATAVISYLQQQLPQALANALNVNVNQITNLNVLLDENQVLVCHQCHHLSAYKPPKLVFSNYTNTSSVYASMDVTAYTRPTRWLAYEDRSKSLTSYQAPVNRLRKEAAEKTEKLHANMRSLKSLDAIGFESQSSTPPPAYYVTFVLIASPHPNATVVTPSTFTDTQVIAALETNFVPSGVTLDTSTSIQVVNVLTAPTQWYSNGGATVVVSTGGGGNGHVIDNTAQASDDFGWGLLVIFIVIVAFVIFCMGVRQLRMKFTGDDDGYETTSTTEISVPVTAS